MKIAVCGSTTHYEIMKKIKQQLEAEGHIAYHPDDAGPKFEISEAQVGIITPEQKNFYIMRHLQTIKKCEAILVVNVDKNNQLNYIGGNTFLEMGFALALDKRIFIYNDIPRVAYREEIYGMLPLVIQQDLTKIK